MLALALLLLVVAACRPAAEEPELTSIGPAEPLPAAETPEASSDEPSAWPADAELIAQVPTPLPGAIMPTPAVLQPEETSVRGEADAPITIVEFSDYQCPYCQRYFNEAYSQVIANYVETGQVRYVFKDFPIGQIHPQATSAAEAARCAGEQDAYWEMHDKLFERQDAWAGQEDPVPAFLELGQAVGLDAGTLQSCLESGRYAVDVQQDLAEGQALGVTGTPTFFIDGYPIVGAQPYDLFRACLCVGGCRSVAGRLCSGADAHADAGRSDPDERVARDGLAQRAGGHDRILGLPVPVLRPLYLGDLWAAEAELYRHRQGALCFQGLSAEFPRAGEHCRSGRAMRLGPGRLLGYARPALCRSAGVVQCVGRRGIQWVCQGTQPRRGRFRGVLGERDPRTGSGK